MTMPWALMTDANGTVESAACDEGGEGDAIAVLASPPMTERLNILKGGAHDEGVHKGFHVQASEDQNRAAAKSNDNDKGRSEKCERQGSLR